VSDTFAGLTVESEHEECRIDLAGSTSACAPSTGTLGLRCCRWKNSLPTRCSRCSVERPRGITRTWRRCAGTKDAGFSAERFLDAIAAFDRLDADDFDLSRAGYERLQLEVPLGPSRSAVNDELAEGAA
jgi:hypothetical protein